MICKQIFGTALYDLHIQDPVSNEIRRMVTECVYQGNIEHEGNIQDKSDCQRIYEQFVEYKVLRVHESFIDGAENAELMKGESPESEDELTSPKEYIIYTKNKNGYQKIYEQYVECKELGVHEKSIDFIDGVENAELMKGKPSESEDELTNTKEYIIYTKDSQNQTEIDCITDEVPTSEFLNSVKDIVGSKDPLLCIVREPLQQNKIMRMIKTNFAMNCPDEQDESERQYHILTNIIGNNSDAIAGAAAAIAITHRGTYAPYMHAGSDRGPETKVFETENPPVVSKFPVFRTFRVMGMVGWQNAHFVKQKHEENKKHAFRPARQQQHEATAL